MTTPANHEVINGNLFVRHKFECGSAIVRGTLQADSLAVTDEVPADSVVQEKVVSVYQAGTVAAATTPVFIATGAGIVKAVKAFIATAPTTTDTVSVDVTIAGTSCLDAPIAFSSESSNADVESGAVDTAANTFAANGILRVAVTGTNSSAAGLLVQVTVQE